jgi:hypothetical protein
MGQLLQPIVFATDQQLTGIDTMQRYEDMMRRMSESNDKPDWSLTCDRLAENSRDFQPVADILRCLSLGHRDAATKLHGYRLVNADHGPGPNVRFTFTEDKDVQCRVHRTHAVGWS